MTKRSLIPGGAVHSAVTMGMHGEQWMSGGVAHLHSNYFDNCIRVLANHPIIQLWGLKHMYVWRDIRKLKIQQQPEMHYSFHLQVTQFDAHPPAAYYVHTQGIANGRGLR